MIRILMLSFELQKCFITYVAYDHFNERQYHLDRGSKRLQEFFFNEYDLQFTDLSQNNQNIQLNSAFQSFVRTTFL